MGMADLPRNFSCTIKTTETTRMHSIYVNGNYTWMLWEWKSPMFFSNRTIGI